jgi:hypothetical protein
MQRLEEKSSASVGDRTPVIKSIVRHYKATGSAKGNNEQKER